MKRLGLVCLLSACGTARPPSLATDTAPLPVWIDTDPAVGIPQRDVDDGLALVLALRRPELVVRGVSVVFGNAELDQGEPIARALVGRAASAQLGVYRGAASGRELGTATAATDALIAALEREDLTILVLGPATNVASVLLLRPDLAPRMRALVAVAGRRPGQRFTTGSRNRKGHRDFNFELDPEAFRVILGSRVPLLLAPFELSSQVWVTEDDLSRLAGGPVVVSDMVAPARQWLELWRDVFGVDGFNPFDTLAIAAVARPDLLTAEESAAAIRLGPDDVTEARMQGDSPAEKPYLVVEPGAGREVTYFSRPSDRFKEWLIESLLDH